MPLPRAISIILFASLLLFAPIAIFIEAFRPDDANRRALFLYGSLLILAVFTVPVFLLFLWGRRSVESIRQLSESARLLAAGKRDVRFAVAHPTVEVAALSRALVELRDILDSHTTSLSQQTHTIEKIVDRMNESLLVVDDRMRIVMTNDRLVETFSLSPPVLGRPLIEVIRSTTLTAAFERALKGESQTSRISVSATRQQLEIHTFPLAGSPQFGAAALFADVSRIEQLERVRRDFLADFSHEFRSPLAALRSAIESLESGRVAPDQEEQLQKIIARQAFRLERLLDDVSHLARIEAGEVVLMREAVPLERLLQNLMDDFAERLKFKKIKATFAGEARANVDPAKMQQVFGNLIDNAIKHSEATEIAVSIESGATDAVIRISDNGDGIAEEELERIFHRFYRIDKSRSPGVPGAGLGLSIAKHLVRLHGGTMNVSSRLGSGTTFEIRLPLIDVPFESVDTPMWPDIPMSGR